MPRIQEYRQQTRSPGGVDFRNAATGGGLGQGLRDVGNVVNEMENDYDRFQKQNAQHNASKKSAQFALEDEEFVTTSLDKYNPNEYKAPEGKPEGWEYSDSIAEELENKKQARLAEVSNSYERQALDDRLTQSNTKFLSESRSKQKATEAKYVKQNAIETQTQYANLVYANPDRLNDSLAKMDDYYGTLPDQYEGAKELLLKESNQVLYDSALTGRVNKLSTKQDVSQKEINSAIKELSGENSPWAKNASDQAFKQSLSTLNKLKENVTQRNNDDFKFQFQQEMDRIKVTGEDRGKFTEKEIMNSGVSPKEKEKMLREQSYARAEGQEFSKIKDLSFEDAAKLVNPEAMDKLLKSDPDNFYLAKSKHDARLQAWTKRSQMLEKDPINYVLKNNDAIKSKKDIFDKALQSGNAGEITSRAEDYASSVIAEQKRLNPFSEPSIIGTNDSANIKYQLDSVTSNPAGVDQAMAVLQNEFNKWGPKYAPVAFKDLKADKAIGSSHYVAATLLNDPSKTPLARDIIMSAVKPVDKRDEKIMKESKEDAEGALESLKRSLMSQADGEEIYQDHENTLSTLLYYYKTTGFDSKADATGLANQIILENYNFENNVRIPSKVSSSNVTRGSRVFLDKIDSIPNLYIPEYNKAILPEDAKEIYVNRLKDKAVWVNDGDRGMMLVSEEGPNASNVMTKNGNELKPIKMTWDELETYNRDTGVSMQNPKIIYTP